MTRRRDCPWCTTDGPGGCPEHHRRRDVWELLSNINIVLNIVILVVGAVLVVVWFQS